VVLILIFGPVSGAHFNPAVTAAFVLRRELPASAAPIYLAAQVAGAIAGAWLAHLMLSFRSFRWRRPRAPVPAMARRSDCDVRPAADDLRLPFAGARAAIPYAVGLYITAAYCSPHRRRCQSGRHGRASRSRIHLPVSAPGVLRHSSCAVRRGARRDMACKLAVAGGAASSVLTS
jgi:hypothetical protein